MKFSKYHLTTDLLNDVGLDNKRIIFSTRTATSILVDENIYQAAQQGRFKEIDSLVLNTLKEKEFLVPDEQDEYRHIMTTNASTKEESNFLSATIQPSANCQLGCHYCGQNHSKHVASDAVIDKYYERLHHLLFSKKIYNGMSITWYGGEPLTGLSSIRKLSRRLIDLCDQNDYTYIADIITNGLNLKPKLFEELVKEYHITNYQITIDGSAEGHDKRRTTKKVEGPTFDIITKNIINVVQTPIYKERNCHISIRVNIDQTNYQYVSPLIEFVKENNLQEYVSMYFAAIVNFGGNDAAKDSLDKDFFAEKEIEWLLQCYEYDISVSVLPSRTYSVCMVEKEDSEVYDAFGNIYACWEFPYSDTYGAGDSLIGNLFYPEETYNKNATLRNWPEVVESGTTWCKSCLHLPVCGGGCPKSWHEGTPACPPFKFNYKDKLLLDYYIRNKKSEE